MDDDLPIKRGVTVPAHALEWTAVRASGPGGQNVNKVATKVDLRFDPERVGFLSQAQRTRLETRAPQLDADGRVVITSQVTRSQARNLEDARQKLAELLRRAMQQPKRRKPTRPTRSSQRKRIEEKRQHSRKKQLRGKVER